MYLLKTSRFFFSTSSFSFSSFARPEILSLSRGRVARQVGGYVENDDAQRASPCEPRARFYVHVKVSTSQYVRCLLILEPTICRFSIEAADTIQRRSTKTTREIWITKRDDIFQGIRAVDCRGVCESFIAPYPVHSDLSRIIFAPIVRDAHIEYRQKIKLLQQSILRWLSPPTFVSLSTLSQFRNTA